MSKIIEVKIPDLGGADKVDVVEVLVEPGQRIERDQGLVTLETEKASMDAPSPAAGIVREIALARGDKVSEGDLILTLEESGKAGEAPREPQEGEPPAASEESRGAKKPPPPPAPSRKATPGQSARSSNPSTDIDLVVLGAGPGGYTAAFRAADLGLRVALVERYPSLGGVCLNVGCIPSKALLHSAKVIDEAAAMAEHGVAFGEPAIDLVKLARFKRGVVDRLTGGLARLAKQRKVEVIQGTGTLISDHTVSVQRAAGGEREISFAQAILATGSRPVQIPGIPYDDPRVMDSTAALELAEIPRRLLVIGGGIIGLEMATIYSALGATVTVVELTAGLIPGCDRDLVRPLERRLADHYGVEILLETKVIGVKANKKSLSAELVSGAGSAGSESARRASFDRILVAVGRRPNGDRLGAEAAGVSVDQRGFVPVDHEQRTNVRHIFAIGDLVGPPLLAHKATHQGKVAAEVAAGEKSAFDARVIPSVAYTDPEIAWAGLTESEAKERGIEIEKTSIPWAASGRALGMGRDDGSTKLLFDPSDQRIVGGGIVGVNAGDLIAEIALAIEMGSTAGDVSLTIHPHPTLSETIAFAAEAYDGSVTDLYLPKRGRRRKS